MAAEGTHNDKEGSLALSAWQERSRRGCCPGLQRYLPEGGDNSWWRHRPSPWTRMSPHRQRQHGKVVDSVPPPGPGQPSDLSSTKEWHPRHLPSSRWVEDSHAPRGSLPLRPSWWQRPQIPGGTIIPGRRPLVMAVSSAVGAVFHVKRYQSLFVLRITGTRKYSVQDDPWMLLADHCRQLGELPPLALVRGNEVSSAASANPHRPVLYRSCLPPHAG